MTTPLKGIADRVRGVAAERRFSQQRIASVVNLSRDSVQQRMNGRVAWTAPELYMLAQEMEVPITRFFPESAAVAA